MAGTVRSRKEGPIGWLTIDNEQRHNAMSYGMWQMMPTILQDMADDPSIRVVVLRGAGDRAFVSGADISEFDQKRGSAEAVRQYDVVSKAAQMALRGFPKPAIAMIKGYCVGGGLAIALECDLRIAAADAKFGIPAAKLGLGYNFDGVKHLADIVGPARAKEVFFTGRLFNAAEAHQMGLVNTVVAAAELEAHTGDYVAAIAQNAPLTIRAAKSAIGEAVKDQACRDLDQVQALIDACFASRDYVEGRQAFKEKRKPRFQGE
jgi:enoyl-CoA hydratase/carnithine racemase